MCSPFWRASGMKRKLLTSHEGFRATWFFVMQTPPLKVTESKSPRHFKITS